MAVIMDIRGTSQQSFQLQKGGARIRNNSGVIETRNAADSAYADIVAQILKANSNELQLNSNAAGAGADWRMSILRPTTGMTGHVNYTMPAAPINGNVLQTDASGNLSWVAAAAAGANTTLSNLGATALNASLIPDTQLTRDLGASGLEFANLYVDSIYGSGYCGAKVIDVNAGTLLDSTGVITVNFSARRLVSSANEVALEWDGVFTADEDIVVRAVDPSGTPLPRAISFLDDGDTNTNRVRVRAPADVTGGVVDFVLPPTEGSNGQVLSTDGNGNTTWVNQTASAATNTVQTDSTSFAFGASSPISLFSLPANAVVHKVEVIVDTAFDGAPTLEIGIAGDTDKYMTSAQNDLTSGAGDRWTSNPNNIPVGGAESLIGTYAAGGATVGAGRIIVHYSNPL